MYGEIGLAAAEFTVNRTFAAPGLSGVMARAVGGRIATHNTAANAPTENPRTVSYPPLQFPRLCIRLPPLSGLRRPIISLDLA